MNTSFNIFNRLRRLPCRRSAVAFLIGFTLLTVWGIDGVQILTALNPTLGRELALAEHPPLDVWISPPSTASTLPTIISTPAGARFTNDTITVPQGSIVSAHLAEQDGDAPQLIIDDSSSTEFTTDAHGDFEATMPLTSGKKLSIRRGWLTLASWKINIVPDTPPTVERNFSQPVSRILLEERKKLLQYPANAKLREDTANILAGIAQEIGNYHNDPVVMMTLRTSAVRLILNDDKDAVSSVSDLLWQAANRIEDGSTRATHRILSDDSKKNSANPSNTPQSMGKAPPNQTTNYSTPKSNF